ncbi:ROK family transcriptional regulator [Tropicimonas marinistellae]|uniref:ROK family transcriptional regulator n=1 Tax=Tropicimonas marinistellae TaxID=1739787 RepID=UPI0008373176|nr:ROK family transcriptional regulator [Tropicimonas marinistellae]
MSMPRAVRHINETRTLEALRRNGPMSRADIARELGVTRSTASALVASLVDIGLLTDAPDGTTEPDTEKRTGRPGTRICVNAEHAFFLGIEVGVGRGSVAVVDLSGKVRATREYRFSLERTTPQKVAELVAKDVRKTLAELGTSPQLRGGIATVPGLVDFAGHVVRAPYLGWRDVPFLDLMRAALPEVELVGLENDANAVAVADMQMTPGARKNVVYLLLDTGIGGCAVADGKVLRGNNGYAGELGHIIIGDKGYSSSERSTVDGSLESYVGRRALFARHDHYGGRSERISDFLTALDAGEKAAVATLDDWTKQLGRGLASIVSVLNPEQIVLCGPLAPLFARGEASARASLGAHLLAGSHVPQLSLTHLGREAPAIGAALLLQHNLFAYDEELLFGG